jgi:hypothetical protein
MSLVPILKATAPRERECFRSPFPYYHDRRINKLIRLDGKDPGPDLMHLLRKLHLLDTQKATKLVASNIRQFGEVSPQRKLYHLSYMSDDAVYLNAGNNQMIKITSDSAGPSHVTQFVRPPQPRPRFNGFSRRVKKA